MTTRGTPKLLEIAYQGYFMCRLATDPDPTNEERGMSGYTMALASEDRLDQVIRLQVTPEFLARNGRKPLGEMGFTIGVNVVGVRFDGKPSSAAACSRAATTSPAPTTPCRWW